MLRKSMARSGTHKRQGTSSSMQLTAESMVYTRCARDCRGVFNAFVVQVLSLLADACWRAQITDEELEAAKQVVHFDADTMQKCVVCR